MKAKIIIAGLFIPILLASLVSQAQDPNYSQFVNNPTYYNPAYTGFLTGIRARFSFRDQWPVLPYDFKAYHFDADLGDRNLPGSGGVGLFINSDNEGLGFIRNLTVGINIAARVQLNQNAVSQLGIRVAWLQKSLNWDDFVFSDQLSEKYGIYYPTSFIRPEQNVRNLPDFGVGGLINYGNQSRNVLGTVGVAIDHLFQPDQSFLQTAKAPLPRKWVIHSDAIISFGSGSRFSQTESFLLTPSLLYQNQGGLNSFQAGMSLNRYGILVGLWYKGSFGDYHNGAMLLMAGYGAKIADNFEAKFAYSYDMQLSGALQGTGGAHEISLIIELSTKGIIGDNIRTTRGRPGFDRQFEGRSIWECHGF